MALMRILSIAVKSFRESIPPDSKYTRLHFFNASCSLFLAAVLDIFLAMFKHLSIGSYSCDEV